MVTKVYILVGHIASGKSGYCKNAAKKGLITLNDDALVNLLHGDDYTLYDNRLKILYKSIENNIFSLGLCLGKSVIIDRGVNVSIKGRKRWIALANSFDVPCEAIVFKIEKPEVHAKRRCEHDGRGHSYEYWLNVAKHHHSIYKEPSCEEGFDKVHCIEYTEILAGKVVE